MSRFDPTGGLIVVRARLTGPTGRRASLRLALDTGATRTLLNVAALVAAGYDPALSPDRVQMTTGSGVEYAPLVRVERLTALGQSRVNLMVLAHTLPPSAGVDGLVGLDFLRGHVLTVDFRTGL